MTSIDYKKYYNLEAYLLLEAGPRFQETGELEPLDFLAILIWKSNRARTKHIARLRAKSGSLSNAVSNLASELHSTRQLHERLQILMEIWGFRLPTATAILSILYPSEFTVYDIRVCKMLGSFHQLAGRSYSPKLWEEYKEFLQTVKDKTPKDLDLRDKDRYLWGKSWYEDTRSLL
jgi:hypothetical protein